MHLQMYRSVKNTDRPTNPSAGSFLSLSSAHASRMTLLATLRENTLIEPTKFLPLDSCYFLEAVNVVCIRHSWDPVFLTSLLPSFHYNSELFLSFFLLQEMPSERFEMYCDLNSPCLSGTTSQSRLNLDITLGRPH
ncbi:hypothetical protein B296_00029661 [Ensete ventricosum]|uniref:Uncharacterized protein n=1 Tax=Ensete ventricosum TaxID=4639 RepID=A0A426YLV6_ENSVE|nr:hypothetical protein B296_00029661 [Ensete ventricosum]